MMRPALPFIVLGCAVAQSCFASARLPDYSVTQIGTPGSDHFVFCSANTCPEPSIKHLASPAPIIPVASAGPLPSQGAAQSLVVGLPDRSARPHRVHVRRVRPMRNRAARLQCDDAAPERGGPEHFAGR